MFTASLFLQEAPGRPTLFQSGRGQQPGAGGSLMDLATVTGDGPQDHTEDSAGAEEEKGVAIFPSCLQ